jgi:hypothetical protein
LDRFGTREPIRKKVNATPWHAREIAIKGKKNHEFARLEWAVVRERPTTYSSEKPCVSVSRADPLRDERRATPRLFPGCHQVAYTLAPSQVPCGSSEEATIVGEIGRVAAGDARHFVSPDPGKDFARELTHVAGGGRGK